MIYVMIGRGNGKNHFKELFEKLAETNTFEISEMQLFEMANIRLTDVQKEWLRKLELKNKEFAQAIINAMHKEPVSIDDILKDFKESIVQPKQDYNQKHKPWKKERFYY